MRTNYLMVKDLMNKFEPVNRSLLRDSEIQIIREELCIPEMDVLQLRNLRDTVVMYSSILMDKHNNSVEYIMKITDICSGICTIIDEEIFGKGGEV